MSLASGVRLGPYQILGPLGAGGMGEVYEARDTRLDRSVAVKVLPERLAADPQLKARFEREARAVSKLSHPHICTLFDVGEADVPAADEGAHPSRGSRTIPYLVMERLEGEPLDERLRRGPLAPEQVLELGRQIAAALAAAHREGIVHRDLKPGNVMVTREGIKLLDFGLARTIREAESPSGTELDALATAPHEETPLTQEGTILGTFFYMSPEQLEAREVDERADIFALGAVLYEMATGRRAFDGESRASVIAAVMSREPEPISRLQPVAPPALDHVVSRCLAKDPEERWQSARDVAAELLWIAQQGSQAGVPAPLARRRRSREAIAWLAAGALGLAALAFAIVLVTRPGPQTASTLRFVAPLPDGSALHRGLALSPDGTRLVFSATDDSGESRLWMRSLDSFETRPLPGTEGGTGPFWSPDGRSIGFSAPGELRRFDLDGSVRTLAAAPHTGAAGTWSSQGVVLYGFERHLLRVPATGGVPTPVPVLPGEEGVLAFWPQFLPDGDRFLLAVFHPERTAEASGLYLGSLSSGERRRLLAVDDVEALSSMAYDETGYLLFARDGTLLAQRLDADRGELLGEPVRVVDRVLVRGPGAAAFAISGNGVLAYVEGRPAQRVQLTWLDGSGVPIGAVGPPGHWVTAQVSPDAQWLVAVQIPPVEEPSLWLLDVARGTSERLTGGYWAMEPLWSPQGDRIAFSATLGTPPNPFLLELDRRGEPVRLARYPFQTLPVSWSPEDGSLVLLKLPGAAGAGELWRLPVDSGGEPEPLFAGEGGKRYARVSPDGRWLAYESRQTGRWEIYVASYPEVGRGRLVSTAGGSAPRWSADGGRLFYVEPDGTIMSVPVTLGPPFVPGLPEPLFKAQGTPLDVAPGGERFLFATPTGEQASTPIRVVVNWRAELGR